MILVAVKHHVERQIAELSVYAHSQKTLLAQLLEKFLVMPLAILYQRCEYIDLVPVISLQDQIDNLIPGIFYHRFACDIAYRRPHS